MVYGNFLVAIEISNGLRMLGKLIVLEVLKLKEMIVNQVLCEVPLWSNKAKIIDRDTLSNEIVRILCQSTYVDYQKARMQTSNVKEIKVLLMLINPI